jgi:hypothetical protein
MLAVPGVAVADLTRAAWRQPGASGWDVLQQCAPSLLAVAVLSVVAVALAMRSFKWEPRH